MTTNGENKELIRRITDKVVNGGDLAIVRELFSEDCVVHKTGLSLPRGPEAFKMAIRQWRDAFPDYRVTIEALFGEGDLVASLFVAEGTHRGSLQGHPPTDKSFKLGGTDVHRVVDGLVVESWLADDLPRILTDVGVLVPGQSSKWT
ncbi:MAG: ester cyclase [Actinomycetota bacterium]|nr:ester cyclase [Actinomycetota bacterium]